MSDPWQRREALLQPWWFFFHLCLYPATLLNLELAALNESMTSMLVTVVSKISSCLSRRLI